MARFRLIVAGIVGTLSCLSILLLVASPSVGVLAGQMDTLELQFQWACPLSVVDMKLADIDQDGASEILVGFDSDSARVGVLDAVAQTMVWQSPGLPGPILSSAAGDRNDDGHLDIAAGGRMRDGSYGEGYLKLFDGPSLGAASVLGPIDHAVTALEIFKLGTWQTRKVVAGTRWNYDDFSLFPVILHFFEQGHLLLYDGSDLVMSDSISSGLVRAVSAVDVYGHSDLQLVSGEGHFHNIDYHGGHNEELDILSIRVVSPDSSLLINVLSGSVFYDDLELYHRASLDAFAAGDLRDDCTAEIIVGWRAVSGPVEARPANLSCFDAVTGDTLWSVADSVYPYFVSGLAICELSDRSAKTVCAAYGNGVIRFRSGTDGSDVAVSCGLPSICHFALGNVDHDNVTEVCIASAGSLYVFEAPFIYTDLEETVNPTRPEAFSLHQNYPNPFNPQTTIRFTVVRRGDIRLTIYNILGERVRDFQKYCAPGAHTISWDGKNSSAESVASGVYLYRLTAGDCEQTRKMLLLR